MKKIKVIFISLPIVITILWFFSDTLFPSPFEMKQFTKSFMQYTGIMAFMGMSVAMLLATRSQKIGQYLHGMDKSYRLHKWLGIAVLVMTIAHWGWKKFLLKWIMGAKGKPPQREGREAAENVVFSLKEFLQQYHHQAEEIGEYALYFLLILLVLALIKKFPYRIFAKTHIVMAIVYLAIVFHTVVLAKFDYWTQPIGIVLGVFTVLGTVSACILLFKQAGKKQKTLATVTNIVKYPNLKTTKIEFKANHWKGHKSGQFAFIDFKKDQEPHHPFTITNAWDKEKKIVTFHVKSLGDYTNTLADNLKIGDRAIVEGAYGCFTFDDKDQSKPQVWIAGGVGVTPFLAKLDELSKTNNKRLIDFFFSAKNVDDNFREMLVEKAKKANVNLHIYPIPNKGRISGEKIRRKINHWKEASFWFCGGSEMGKQIKGDLVRNGLKSSSFEQELFEMR